MIKASIPWTAKQVAKMYDNHCLKFDNAIQRGDVWDNKKRSMFVDSILRGYPVPPIFAIKSEETVKDNRGRDISTFDCIDGKQRSTTMSQFRNNQFSLIGLEPIVLENGDEFDLNGLMYDELPEELRDEFDGFSINVIYFSDITEDEVSEMMFRLNNGKPLTNVENARIKAKDLAGIIDLAKHQIFEEYMTETARKGYHNEDVVIKTYIQFTNPDDPCFDSKRTKQIYLDTIFDDSIKARLNGIFDKAMETISIIENNAPKKVFRKVTKKTNLLAVISLMESPLSTDELAQRITAFFDTEDGLSVSAEYNEASSNGTNHAPQVKTRNAEIAKIL